MTVRSPLIRRLFLACGLALGLTGCAPAESKAEHAVILHLKLSDEAFGAEGESFGLYPVEEAIEAALGQAGQWDGHEIGGGYFTIYLYGADADAMQKAIQPALDRQPIPPGSYLVKRRGAPGAAEEKVALASA